MIRNYEYVTTEHSLTFKNGTATCGERMTYQLHRYKFSEDVRCER